MLITCDRVLQHASAPNNMRSLYLTELLPTMKTSCYSLRLNRAPSVPNFRTERFKSTFRLGLSHLREHKFRHNFNDTIDPFCLYGTNSLETSQQFLLHCQTYACLRRKLFDNLYNNNILLLPLEKSLIVQILLYGSDNYNPSMNKIIISTVIDFIIQSKRFEVPLIQ